MEYFIEPTIFTDLHTSHTGYAYIVKEEIFSRVVAISKFKYVDEVVAQVNDITYVICYNALSEKKLFGGYKQSGINRENSEYVCACKSHSSQSYVSRLTLRILYS
ncbi:hypothetical protein BDC45DRAFT_530825 [Circinella umbellata]|nr:hypothetical protein BDC45DRAFT_530825 [Circinella umbellata]